MPRICFLRYGDELIIDSLARGFEKLGFDTKTVIFDPANIAFEKLRLEIESFAPDACFTHNFYVFDLFKTDRSLENYLCEKQIPCVAWFWDSPIASGSEATARRYLFENVSPNILSLASDSGHYEFLKGRGVRSDFLPLGVADEFFAWSNRLGQKPQSPLSFDLSFSGKPVHFMGQEPLKDEEQIWLYYTNAFLVNFLSGIKLQFPSSEENEKGKALLVDCFRDAVTEFFSLLYTDTIAYQNARRAFVERIRNQLGDFMSQSLLPALGRLDFMYSWFQLNIYLHRLMEFDLGVFGGDAWANSLLPHLKQKSPRLSQEELLELFRFSKISFCLTKWHFQNMAHERVFIAYGCGGFPITDYRKDLVNLFEKDELVMYHEIEEAQDLIRYYLKNESERLRIAAKGRTRVMREHCYSHRAAQIAKIMHEHFGVPLAKAV
jgi:hypothetical protein